MILWHRTSRAAAESIRRGGFQDSRDTYMTGREHSGVWLSDAPLDCNEGAFGDVLLRVNLACTEDEIERWEWVEEGKGYREWLIPAALVNSRAKHIAITSEQSALTAWKAAKDKARRKAR